MILQFVLFTGFDTLATGTGGTGPNQLPAKILKSHFEPDFASASEQDDKSGGGGDRTAELERQVRAQQGKLSEDELRSEEEEGLTDINTSVPTEPYLVSWQDSIIGLTRDFDDWDNTLSATAATNNKLLFHIQPKTGRFADLELTFNAMSLLQSLGLKEFDKNGNGSNSGGGGSAADDATAKEELKELKTGHRGMCVRFGSSDLWICLMVVCVLVVVCSV